MVKDKGVPVMCCGQKMTKLIPGTTDAAVEKHVGNNQYCKNKKKYCCFVHNPQFAAKNGTIHLCTLYYAKVDILIEETNVSVTKVCSRVV